MLGLEKIEGGGPLCMEAHSVVRCALEVHVVKHALEQNMLNKFKFFKAELLFKHEIFFL